MISIASCAYAMSGIALDDALWNIPAALAYQLNLLYWQRQGAVIKRDTRDRILKEL